MEKQYNLLDVLEHVDPSQLDYQGWVNVGMALKEEGYQVADWDTWSRRDAGRYHARECERKWNTFRGTSQPVTGGTIVQYAREQGWEPAREGYELNWDSIIEKDSQMVVDKNWIEGRELQEPGENWEPEKDLIRYLETLFEASENVGYVTKSWEKDGKYLPSKGNWDRTAGQLIQELAGCGGDIGSVLGDYEDKFGAWIRFNPLDGTGCKNENVTEFRYALLESDNMELEQQNAIIRELELPVACLVYSGNKSLHAIIKIDASGYEEYRKRVDYLYAICQKNGMKVDTQNRNPSRLSRMPGVVRNGKKQYLIDTNIGKASWEEWHEWIENINDDLPDPESLAEVWDCLPELSPCLIEGMLRQGHKMLIAGPSKAGKSFLQIELCIAVAEGRKWLGRQCSQGKVLYVNLEVDAASCLHRFRDVYQALGWPARNLSNLDIWNLRGKSVPMDKLAPKLIRRAAKKNYLAVVIDPIYKVITGDENSADQMARFCNQFDKVCTELGCAVIYCHHHSKGAQGGKKSMDRASGSGVFARDPDALLDLIELDLTEELMKQEENKAICRACILYLDAHFAWRDDLGQDALCSSSQMLAYCEEKLDKWQRKALMKEVEEEKERTAKMTAWRIEGTLREFPPFAPINLWFRYPVHVEDESGVLSDINPESALPLWQKKTDNRTPEQKQQERDNEKRERLRKAFEACDMEGKGRVPIKDIESYIGVGKNTIKTYIDLSEDFTRENGMVVRVGKKEEAEGEKSDGT